MVITSDDQLKIIKLIQEREHDDNTSEALASFLKANSESSMGYLRGWIDGYFTHKICKDCYNHLPDYNQEAES